MNDRSYTGHGAERLHALDALRAAALLAGIALHATMPFIPDAQMWIVRDQPNIALTLLFYVVHMARMPVFFLIAGFFAHLSLDRRGARGFVRDRAVRIAAPLFVFLPIVGAALAGCVVWMMRSGYPLASSGQARPEVSLTSFPLGHLWFLYMLMLLYAAALLLRGAFVLLRGDADARQGWLRGALVRTVSSPALALALALPLAAAFLLMPEWRAWLGVAPPAFGFVPNAAALVAYGSAFALGWLLQGRQELLRPLQRWWAVQIALAVPLTAYCWLRVGIHPNLDFAPRDSATSIYAACYAIAVWAWTLGLTGAALRYLNAERPAIRYLADSSYWMYLIHLPLLGALQVAIYRLTAPPLVKYLLVLTVAFVLLLTSYHVLVRYTFLGRWLSGSRFSRHRSSQVPVANG